MASLREGKSTAGRDLFDAYGGYVRKVLMRVLGPDRELDDLVQDVFVMALESLHKLENPRALRGWLAQIAVFRARRCLRGRKQWRILRFFAPEEMPPGRASTPDFEASEALRAAYRLLVAAPGRRTDRLRAALHRRHGPRGGRRGMPRFARDDQEAPGEGRGALRGAGAGRTGPRGMDGSAAMSDRPPELRFLGERLAREQDALLAQTRSAAARQLSDRVEGVAPRGVGRRIERRGRAWRLAAVAVLPVCLGALLATAMLRARPLELTVGSEPGAGGSMDHGSGGPVRSRAVLGWNGGDAGAAKAAPACST